MNWIDLLTQFDWQKIATAAIAIAVAWWERRNIKEAAVSVSKKAFGVFKKQVKQVKASSEEVDAAEVFAHLMHVRKAVEHDKGGRRCIRYLGAMLAQPADSKPEKAK
jgi:hypothetical protein